MNPPGMIEVEYSNFLSILRDATNSKQTIDKTNKEAWAAFVKKHGVPEAGCM